MRILVTSGGTSERIDDVRSITNHASGQLGRLISEEFLNHQINVDLITTPKAIKPSDQAGLSIHLIEDTAQLKDTLEQLLIENTYDAIIHSMAVSDFTYEKSFSEEHFEETLSQLQTPITKEVLADLLTAAEAEPAHKISSDTDHLILVLKKTPKVIQMIKKLQPRAKLVGFKLLSDVSKEELLATARENLVKNNADFVLANDLSNIDETQHIGYLIDKNWQITGEAKTKKEIAHLIYKTLWKELN